MSTVCRFIVSRNVDRNIGDALLLVIHSAVVGPAYVCQFSLQSEQVEKKDEEEEQLKDPAYVPRRDAFWSHDDRWDDSQQDEVERY